MEILISVIAKTSEYIVEPVGRELGYLCFINSNFQKLKTAVEKLDDTRNSVKGMVDNARRNAENIKPVVTKWLSGVDDIVRKSEELLVNEVKHGGLCSTNVVQRFKISRKASKMADKLLVMKNEGNFDVVGSLVESSLPTRIVDFLDFESRKSTMKQIMDALVDDNVNRIGVYGMGGVGKTMLVKEILREIMEKKSFDEVVISTISQTPDVKIIQGQLADMLGLKFEQETIEGRAVKLQKRLKMEKSILVVFDDVWGYLDLETIGIVDSKGCKILFTSRERHLLSNEMCIGNKNIFEIKVLEKDESWNLFQQTVGIDHEIDEDLKPIANQIVMECAGLPIAITTVAKALKYKPFSTWIDALDQLKKPVAVNIKGMDKKVYSSLKLSYDYLEYEEVKLLFLLCSMFPEDFDINVEDLQVYAMGMGFLRGADTVAQGRRRITKLVDDLISSSLLLQSESKKNYHVKMHDLIRDVAILIASEDDQLVRTLSYVNREVGEWEEEKLSGNHTAVYLDIQGPSFSLPQKLMLPKVQLLRLHRPWFSKHELVETTLFEEIEELKCLELLNVEISLLPPFLCNSFANIKLLRLLDCKLENIDMIGELRKLEILSFEGSNVVQLPTTISQLTQLKVLDLSSCLYLIVIPPNILLKLTKLEELYLETFDGWEEEGSEGRKNASLSELRYLSHLYVLNLKIQDEKIMPNQLFSGRLDLEKFQITIGRMDMTYLQWNDLSRMLCLEMESERLLDDWIKTLLKRSEKVCLAGSIGTKILHSELHGNDSLHWKHLHLFNNVELQHFIHEQNKNVRNILSNLECLEMVNLKNLESIIHGYIRESPFNKLRKVTVRNCKKLETLFSNCSLNDILNLKRIEIYGCNKIEVIINVMENEEATNQLIEFTHLKSLLLRGLPRLQKICSKIKKLGQLSLHNSERTETSTISNDGSSFFSEEVSFPNLEELEIDGADNLKMIWHNILNIPNSFSKLKEVEISSCHSLEKVFPSNIMSVLTSLNRLIIQDCNLLEGIFEEVQDQVNVIETKSSVVLLPNLRELELFNLPNLEYISSKDPCELLIFKNIEDLSIQQCPKLKRPYPLKILKQLQGLDIDFGDLTEVLEKEKSVQIMFESKQFETSEDGPGLFSKLKSLSLFGSLDYKVTQLLPMEIVRILHNLVWFEVRRTFIEEIFPNNATSMSLEGLHLSELPKLRHLWKENSHQNIPSLKKLFSLTISRCSLLKNVFPSSISFTSLCGLEVNECHRLENVLDPSIARNLVLLQYLILRRCKRMSTVMAERDEDQGNDEIVFNQLERITLENFPELKNFYSGKCIIRFPFLTEVYVTDCPEMKTFSLGVVSTPHLLTKNIISKSDNGGLSIPKDHSGKTIVKDINVVFRRIWEDNYDTDVKYLFAEQNLEENKYEIIPSSSSHVEE